MILLKIQALQKSGVTVLQSCAALAAALFTLTAPSLRADTYINNLAETTDSTANLVNNWFGTNFSTDNSASSFNLESVTVSIFDATDPGSSFILNIYTDNLGEPGALVGALTGSAPTGAGNFTYTATAIALSGSTNYWLVAQVSGASTYLWGSTTSTTIGGTWTTSTGGSFSSDSGATWINQDPFQDRSQYSLTASPVPEPSAYAMILGACALGLTLWRRSRRHS